MGGCIGRIVRGVEGNAPVGQRIEMALFGYISATAVRCRKCSNVSPDRVTHRKVDLEDRPSYDTLVGLKRTMSFSSIGKMYGVSDNTIRKWVSQR
jgi:hypothetical protein